MGGGGGEEESTSALEFRLSLCFGNHPFGFSMVFADPRILIGSSSEQLEATHRKGRNYGWLVIAVILTPS